MKSYFKVLLTTTLFTILLSGQAFAVESILHDFGELYNPENSYGFIKDGSRDYVTIDDSTIFIDKFDFTGDFQNVIVDSLSVEISYSSTLKDDNWFTFGGDSENDLYKLGKLPKTDGFVSTTFELTRNEYNDLFTSIIANGYFFVSLDEVTSNANTDELNLDFIKVSISTSPVPVPGAILLFGSGLLCLVGIRRRNGI